jgi:hypothetical protein
MDIRNRKIIWCIKSDIALYWVHNLTQNKVLYFENDIHQIYYSELFDVFFVYYRGEDNDEVKIFNDLLSLTNQFNNQVHAVFCDFRCMDNILKTVDDVDYISYSIVNHMGEMVYNTHPRNIKDLKNIKYYFSCSDLFDENNTVSDFQNTNKFILDYRYSLTYFYFKLGFNFIQKGDYNLNPSQREDKVFLYTKAKENSQRQELIDMVLSTNRIKSKEFNEHEMFWFKHNNSTHHTSFIIDYNSCKFNLVMETQPLQKHSNTLSNFCSEKTLKSLMVSTPSYVVLQESVYQDLKRNGFYFLNEEFGEYSFNNYKTFCFFLHNSNETELTKLYTKSYEYSKLNKLILEEYIYSDKVEEIELLTNKN